MSRASPPRVGAVVLAAGASTRLGTPKQLLVHAGEPLVRRAAAAALAAGAASVVVVLGAHADAVAVALAGLPVTLHRHGRWSDGMASSLAAGIAALGDGCDGTLLTLVDQPLVDTPALAELLAVFDATHRVVAAEYAGTLGAPAVVAHEHLPSLLASLSGDTGAGRWLRAHAAQVTRVPLPAAAFDVDTAADAERLMP